MNILSLFDGMSCGYIAFKESNIPIDSYYAYEIEEAAIKTSKYNFPDIVHCGDVFKADFKQYQGKIDFLVGGSPCTYWSIAQKPGKREVVNEGFGWNLFCQYIRALREVKPKYFIYENNFSMDKKIRESIDEQFDFDGTLINSALVSAQNRQRLYWVGIRNDETGDYDKVKITQPQDRYIFLKDILESGEDFSKGGKSYCLTTRINGAEIQNTLERSQRDMIAEPICLNSKDKNNKQPSIENRIYDVGGKMTAVTTAFNPSICESMEFINSCKQVGLWPRNDKIENSQDSRIYSEEGKSTTLLAGNKGLYATKFVGNFPQKNKKSGNLELNRNQSQRIYDENGKGIAVDTSSMSFVSMKVPEATKEGFANIEVGQCVDLAQENSKTRRGRKMGGESNCLTTQSEFYQYMGNLQKPIYEVKDGLITIKGKEYPIRLKDGFYMIRKLTVRECMRLQTIPEWYSFDCVSKTAAYKMIGNGWTVEVIRHLIDCCLKGETVPKFNQINLFDLL